MSIIIANPTLLWLIAGAILCFMELIFPTAFVEFMMGVSAFLVAVVSLIIPYFPLQVVLWLLFSTLSIVLSRRYLSPKKRLMTEGNDQEGETLTEILPGELGRVLYEGNSWRAKCADENIAIAANEKVYVVRYEGTTLIVLPYKILKS
jgi:membrane protein implicated in regulation of membrane protease activity